MLLTVVEWGRRRSRMAVVMMGSPKCLARRAGLAGYTPIACLAHQD